jgi:hypothetical protein
MVWGKDQMHLLLHMAQFKDLAFMFNAILDDLHTMMYMPIELGENIKAFMTRGKNKVIESFTQHLPDVSWTQ